MCLMPTLVRGGVPVRKGGREGGKAGWVPPADPCFIWQALTGCAASAVNRLIVCASVELDHSRCSAWHGPAARPTCTPGAHCSCSAPLLCPHPLTLPKQPQTGLRPRSSCCSRCWPATGACGSAAAVSSQRVCGWVGGWRALQLCCQQPAACQNDELCVCGSLYACQCFAFIHPHRRYPPHPASLQVMSALMSAFLLFLPPSASRPPAGLDSPHLLLWPEPDEAGPAPGVHPPHRLPK